MLAIGGVMINESNINMVYKQDNVEGARLNYSLKVLFNNGHSHYFHYEFEQVRDTDFDFILKMGGNR